MSTINNFNVLTTMLSILRLIIKTTFRVRCGCNSHFTHGKLKLTASEQQTWAANLGLPDSKGHASSPVPRSSEDSFAMEAREGCHCTDGGICIP